MRSFLSIALFAALLPCALPQGAAAAEPAAAATARPAAAPCACCAGGVCTCGPACTCELTAAYCRAWHCACDENRPIVCAIGAARQDLERALPECVVCSLSHLPRRSAGTVVVERAVNGRLCWVADLGPGATPAEVRAVLAGGRVAARGDFADDGFPAGTPFYAHQAVYLPAICGTMGGCGPGGCGMGHLGDCGPGGCGQGMVSGCGPGGCGGGRGGRWR